MSIVILSVIMSVASLQIIKESCTKIIGLSDGSSDPPAMNYVTIGIASTTVGKGCMVHRGYKHLTIKNITIKQGLAHSHFRLFITHLRMNVSDKSMNHSLNPCFLLNNS